MELGLNPRYRKTVDVPWLKAAWGLKLGKGVGLKRFPKNGAAVNLRYSRVHSSAFPLTSFVKY